VDPGRVVDTRCTTGEGPIWHPDAAVLYWVDIPTGTLYRYDPATDENAVVYDDPAASLNGDREENQAATQDGRNGVS